MPFFILPQARCNLNIAFFHQAITPIALIVHTLPVKPNKIPAVLTLSPEMAKPSEAHLELNTFENTTRNLKYFIITCSQLLVYVSSSHTDFTQHRKIT